MAIQKNIIDIPLTGGVDTKTAEKLVQPGSNLKTENVYMQNTGEIRKRFGYANMPRTTYINNSIVTDGELDKGHAIYSYDDGLVIIAHDSSDGGQKTYHGPNMFCYSDGRQKWIETGTYQPVSFTVEPVTAASEYFGHPSVTEGDGLQCIVYEDNISIGRARADVIDKETGVKFLEKENFNTGGFSPQCAYLEDGYGKHFVLLAIEISGGDLQGTVVDTTSPKGPDDITISTTTHSDQLFDMDKLPLDGYDEAVIAYKKANGKLAVQTLNGEGSIHRSIEINCDPANALCVRYVDHDTLGEAIFVVFQTGSGDLDGYRLDTGLGIERYQRMDTTFTTDVIKQITLSPSYLVADSIGPLSLWVEIEGHEPYRNYVQHHWMKWYMDLSGHEQAWRAGLASKAFTYNGHSCALLTHESVLQSTYFLAVSGRRSGLDFIYAAKLFNGTGGGLNTTNGLSNVVQVGTDHFKIALMRQNRLLSDQKRDYQVMVVDFDMDPDPFPSVQVGPTKIIGGGTITAYDGKYQELGSHLHPENISIEDPNSAAGGVLDDGYRWVKAVYSWVDRNGEVYRSAPSAQAGIDMTRGTAEQRLTVTCPHLAQTQGTNKSAGGAGESLIEIYRTIDNGSTFYLEQTDRNSNTHTLDLLNTTGVGAIEDDEAIQNNEILYTTGGEVPNIAPPGSVIMAARTNRVFLVPMDDPQAIWYSKPKVKGLGVNFSDEMVIRVEQGGNITGLATMDDNVIIFKEDDIYYFAGEGPNVANAGTFFSPVRRVATDVGCVNHNSIVSTNVGVIFKSRKGIYLLDRSLQVQYIGAPVEYYNDWDVVRSVLVEDKNQVRFVLSGGQPMLVWDYYHNQWSTWTNHSAVDACVHDGVFYMIDSTGRVKKENEGNYLDVSHLIPITVRTPWIKTSGIQNFQRVTHAMVLGEFRSHHTLTVNVYIDYDDTTSVQTATYDTTGGNHVAGEPYQFEFQLGTQKCQSIMFEISDGSYAGTYESVRLTGLSLRVGVKKGTAKLPDRKQV